MAHWSKDKKKLAAAIAKRKTTQQKSRKTHSPLTKLAIIGAKHEVVRLEQELIALKLFLKRV
jgi:hypothetical protein